MNKRVNKVYRSTWNEARGYFPGQKHAGPPPMTIRRKTETGGLVEASSDGSLTLSRALAKSLASDRVHRRRIGQYALAHDFAHLFQNHLADLDANRSEGGAEVFARRFGKKELGLTARDLRPQSYSGAAARFRKRYGMAEAMKGQFREPVAGYDLRSVLGVSDA